MNVADERVPKLLSSEIAQFRSNFRKRRRLTKAFGKRKKVVSSLFRVLELLEMLAEEPLNQRAECNVLHVMQHFFVRVLGHLGSPAKLLTLK